MSKAPAEIAIRVMALFTANLAAACSGGGGPAPVTTPTSTTSSSSQPAYCASCVSPATLGANGDAGIPAGPIAAPAPASFGTAAQQTALPVGPTFDGSNGIYPANVTFPLISTGLQAASSGMSAVAASPGATATVVKLSGGSSTLQLVIPSANINTTLNDLSLVSPGPGDSATWGYSYVVLGEWIQRGGTGNIQSQVEYAFGYETPAAAMPTNGTATFSGYADASVYKPASGTIVDTYITGNANLSVNFSSGQVTGALTKMQQSSGVTPGAYLPWNDVSLNASIAPGTSRFSGSTAAASAPGTGFSMAGSATGHVDGALYGPVAQNIGAVWSLGDGSESAIGTIGAKQ